MLASGFKVTEVKDWYFKKKNQQINIKGYSTNKTAKKKSHP